MVLKAPIREIMAMQGLTDDLGNANMVFTEPDLFGAPTALTGIYTKFGCNWGLLR